MEVTLLYAIAFVLTSIFLIFLKHVPTARGYRLPPSPAPSLPVLGHLHLLKQPLHRTLQRFSQTHGPIVSLRFGTRPVVVVSSFESVEECFTTNDIVLANRPRSLMSNYFSYDNTTIVASPYGVHWRRLRRVWAQEFFSSARLNDFSQFRHDEVTNTIRSLVACTGESGSRVEMRSMLFQLIFNITMRMLTGKRYSEDGSGHSGHGYQELIVELFENGQASNPEDFLPFLLWIDYRGLKKKMADLAQKFDNLIQSLMEEQRQDKRDTIIGHLLSLQESDPEFYTDQMIKGFTSNVILGGTETTSTTTEWAMALLLNHPDILQKAKLEIDSQVGHDRLIEEQDLPNLSYLQNIISEVLRLFPVAPLGVPHESSSDCKIGGYDVPPGTILFFNTWAIHRDPQFWDEPTSFKPERFQGKESEKHRMIPFGLGRRACPGSGLGQRAVGLVLGSLIQCFEWKRVSSEEVDLAEGPGLTMPMLNPLQAVCKPRQVMSTVFKTLV